ncbi:hypothetical protein POM88_018069 [Heracleum sosnowskyi]|uniref:Uncharacterized protein n=1 Tax=Heracleum sosnowskyi TaxID=360622 RepID=A0AAD8IS42_9APIA|nr:hypothetical protein POM88_018069 [Heracleum sosnowskyi]
MYVTRLLSHYEKNREALSVLPEGPNSGYLVIQDEKAETLVGFYTYSEVVFIPVINQPLSCNREGFTCLKEEQVTCPHCKTRTPWNTIEDLSKTPVDQQFQIYHVGTTERGNNIFQAKSITNDGFPPEFLRTSRWCIRTTRPRKHKLAEALGLDSDLRARSTDTNIQISCKSSVAVKVGMWVAVWDEKNVVDKAIWFKGVETKGEEVRCIWE